MENVKNFNKVLYQSVEKLNESSINRMLQWLIDCDCAFITAFRKELKDVRDEKLTYLGPDNDWQLGKKFTHEENMQKNKDLLANLLLYGYGVAKIKGAYPEGMANENSEESYLAYIIHSGFISGYQNRYGDNLKPPTNVYHRMTA